MAKFNKDSIGGTITVVVLLSLVCSIIVAGSATLLKPRQEEQKLLDKQKSILRVADLLPAKATGKEVREIFAHKIETRCVDLDAGTYTQCPAGFDAVAAAKNPKTSQPIPADLDKAGLRVRAKLAQIYLVKGDNGQLQQMVLPIYGTGLWSVMYGFVSVAPNGDTLKGITYYDEGETPGLGGEIENPKWQAQFVGKKLFNAQGQSAIVVGKGAASNPVYGREHGIDSLTGATLTSNGVQGTFSYWFGPNGFGPFLDHFRKGELK